VIVFVLAMARREAWRGKRACLRFAGTTSTFREFPKRRNERFILFCRSGLIVPSSGTRSCVYWAPEGEGDHVEKDVTGVTGFVWQEGKGLDASWRNFGRA